MYNSIQPVDVNAVRAERYRSHRAPVRKPRHQPSRWARWAAAIKRPSVRVVVTREATQ